MTVKELVEALGDFPDDQNVTAWIEDDGTILSVVEVRDMQDAEATLVLLEES